MDNDSVRYTACPFRVIGIEKTIVGRNAFHNEFVSASGDSFAALSRNEARNE
jgi:hypothetical protein